MGYGTLASTGASIAIGGVILDQFWLVGASLGLVVAGALVIRYGFRRGKSPEEV